MWEKGLTQGRSLLD